MAREIEENLLENFWLTRLAIFFCSWSGFAVFKTGAPVQISLVLVLLAYLFETPKLCMAGRLQRIFSNGDHIFMLLALVAIGLSTLKYDQTLSYMGKGPIASGIRQTASLLMGLSFYFLMYLSISTWSELKTALKTYVAGAVIPLLFGILEIINNALGGTFNAFLSIFTSRVEHYAFSQFQGTNFSRISLITPEPSFGAVYAQTIFALGVGLFIFAEPNTRKKIWAKVLCFFGAVFSFLTLAKTLVFTLAFLNLGLVLLFRGGSAEMLTRTRALRRTIYLLAPTLLVLAVVVLGIRLVSLGSGNVIDDVSTWTRSYNLLVGLKMAIFNPILGVGWGSFSQAYGEYQLDTFDMSANVELQSHFLVSDGSIPLSTYNLFVFIAAEAGFPAAILMGLFLTRSIGRVLKFASGTLDRTHGALATMSVLGYLVTLGGALSTVNFNVYYFWLFCAAVHSVGMLARSDSKEILVGSSAK